MTILTADWETTTKSSYKRKANPFDPDNKVVIYGIKHNNQPTEIYYLESLPDDWLKDVKVIVAHNAKFDFTWVWGMPSFRQWLKEGGKLFCTQYAEYLLSGQSHMFPSLDECSLKYGGVLKNDEIKEFWLNGIDTLDIPKDMLVDYAKDDVDNTYLIFKKQLQEIRNKGLVNTVQTHMEALLGLIEMEYNGLYVDKAVAEKQEQELVDKIEEIKKELDQFKPELPEEIEWNWGSKNHLSALLFGGKIKYRKKVPKLDEEGNEVYTQAKEDWYMINGEAIDPKTNPDPAKLDTYKSGTKAGKIKTKKVTVQGELKTVYQDFFYELSGIVDDVDPAWETKVEGVYTTNDEVLGLLSNDGVEVATKMKDWRKYDKDLGTYYKRYDPKKKAEVGMLTLVQSDGIIHHMLNNVATVTGRLSSSNPNLQNIPRKDKSNVKKVFASRWGKDGRMCECDFSQLEIVVQGLLTNDSQLVQDIVNGICFHCARAAKKLGETYEHVYQKAKIEHDPKYVAVRQDSKEFSFQKAYGAGAKSISASTGIPLEDIEEFIRLEDEMYPGVVEFNDNLMNTIKRSRVITNRTIKVNGLDFNIGMGEYAAPTGKIYKFFETEAPKFLQKPYDKRQAPVFTSFSPTQAKNYPIQGTAGEIVLLCIGVLFREFLKRDNFGGKALLVNTVHDCIWLDCHKDVALEATKLVQEILESADKLITERYNIPCPVVFRAESEIGNNMLELVSLHRYEENLIENEEAA